MEPKKGNINEMINFMDEINHSWIDERNAKEVIENLNRYAREAITKNELLKIFSFTRMIHSDIESKKEKYPAYYNLLIDKVEILEQYIDTQIQVIEMSDQENKPKTFKAKFTELQLKKIRKRLLGAKIIDSISENDFLYLFTEQPITKGMFRLIWKETRPFGHEFLKRVVYSQIEFDFNQVNECINSKDGKLFDSNCKSTAQYKNKKLDPILDV